MTTELILFVAASLLLVSLLLCRTGFKFGLPALLMFLVVGMLFGSDGLGIKFDNTKQAQFVGTLSLCVILFSGGMGTKWKEIQPVLGKGVMLSTVGVLLTTVITGAFIYWVTPKLYDGRSFTLLLALLLAATMSSTDSASVFNLLSSQKMNLKHRLRPILEFESGSNDPMAYLLTIVLLQAITDGTFDLAVLGTKLVVQFAVGLFFGFGMGKIIVWSINRITLQNGSLYALFLFSTIFITFAVSNACGGNGFLSVYVAGMLVGNSRIARRREIESFMDGMTWLVQIVMFLSLGLLVNPSDMMSVILEAVVVGAFLMVVVRPVSVVLCLLPWIKEMNPKAVTFISWVGLRGAVPIIFATYPVAANIPGSEIIFNIVFFITLLSLLVQGTTIPFVARKLKLDEPLEEHLNSFGVELPEETGSYLTDLVVTPDILSECGRLMNARLPKGALVVLVRRGDDYQVPNGQLVLENGDVLLLLQREENNA